MSISRPTMRLLHIADIHVKDERRAEYQRVFAGLGEAAAKEAPDAIVVAGDVFDRMVTMTALNLNDVAALFARLAEIAPLVVIPGNHDVNTRVEGAPDLLSPLFTAAGGALRLQPPRTRYWRHTAVARDHLGADWIAVGPDEAPPSLGEVNKLLSDNEAKRPLVMVFHQSVDGARLAGRHVVRGMEQSAMISRSYLAEVARMAAAAGVAFAALGGDVHIRQQLGDLPAWYCGSLLRQDFGEDPTGHGYLLWTIAGGAVDVRGEEIYNEEAVVKIIIQRGVSVTPKPLPKRPRRWCLEYDRATSDTKLAALTEKLVRMFGKQPCERRLVVTGAATAAAATVPQLEHAAARAAARNINTQLDMIAEVVGAQNPLLVALRDEHVRRAGAAVARAAASARVRLLRMEFDDMMCFGAGNYIDFTAMEGSLSGAIAPNRSGKSAIMDILLYALYDYVPRGTKTTLPREGTSRGRVRVEVEIDGTRYIIVRDGLVSGAARSRAHVRFFVGGEECTAATILDTSKEIRRVIGEPEDALLVSVVGQFDGAPDFVRMSSADRRRALTRLLQLGRFEQIEKEVKLERAECRAALRELDAQDVDGAPPDTSPAESTMPDEARADAALTEARSALEAALVAAPPVGAPRDEQKHADVSQRWQAVKAMLGDMMLADVEALDLQSVCALLGDPKLARPALAELPEDIRHLTGLQASLDACVTNEAEPAHLPSLQRALQWLRTSVVAAERAYADAMERDAARAKAHELGLNARLTTDGSMIEDAIGDEIDKCMRTVFLAEGMLSSTSATSDHTAASDDELHARATARCRPLEVIRGDINASPYYVATAAWSAAEAEEVLAMVLPDVGDGAMEYPSTIEFNEARSLFQTAACAPQHRAALASVAQRRADAVSALPLDEGQMVAPSKECLTVAQHEENLTAARKHLAGFDEEAIMCERGAATEALRTLGLQRTRLETEASSKQLESLEAALAGLPTHSVTEQLVAAHIPVTLRAAAAVVREVPLRAAECEACAEIAVLAEAAKGPPPTATPQTQAQPQARPQAQPQAQPQVRSNVCPATRKQLHTMMQLKASIAKARATQQATVAALSEVQTQYTRASERVAAACRAADELAAAKHRVRMNHYYLMRQRVTDLTRQYENIMAGYHKCVNAVHILAEVQRALRLRGEYTKACDIVAARDELCRRAQAAGERLTVLNRIRAKLRDGVPETEVAKEELAKHRQQITLHEESIYICMRCIALAAVLWARRDMLELREVENMARRHAESAQHIAHLRKAVAAAEKTLTAVRRRAVTLAAERARAEERARAHQERAARRAVHKARLDLLTEYARVIDVRTGLGAILLRRARMQLQNEINTQLRALQGASANGLDFEVQLDDEFELYTVDPPRKNEFESRRPSSLASGYQRFVLSLATRLALHCIAEAPVLDALLIDEGFGALDTTHMAAAGAHLAAMAVVGRPRIIFIVTHVGSLRDAIARTLPLAQTAEGHSQVMFGVAPSGGDDDLPAAGPRIAKGKGGQADAEDTAATTDMTDAADAADRADIAEDDSTLDVWAPAGDDKIRCRVCARDMQHASRTRHTGTNLHKKRAALFAHIQRLVSNPDHALEPRRDGAIVADVVAADAIWCTRCEVSVEPKFVERHVTGAAHVAMCDT